MGGRETRVAGRWKPANAGVEKINFDGAIFEERKEGGFGVVARSAEGECTAWSSHRYIKPIFLELVEMVAAREAMALAIRFGWQEVFDRRDQSCPGSRSFCWCFCCGHFACSCDNCSFIAPRFGGSLYTFIYLFSLSNLNGNEIRLQRGSYTSNFTSSPAISPKQTFSYTSIFTSIFHPNQINHNFFLKSL